MGYPSPAFKNARPGQICVKFTASRFDSLHAGGLSFRVWHCRRLSRLAIQVDCVTVGPAKITNPGMIAGPTAAEPCAKNIFHKTTLVIRYRFRLRFCAPMMVQFSIASVDYECLLKHIEMHSPAYQALLAAKRGIAISWLITCRPLDGIRILQLAHDCCPDAADAIRTGIRQSCNPL